jgi:hypothetical protein
MAPNADRLLTRAFGELGLKDASDAEKYARIDDIVARLERYNAHRRINPKTTGTLSERLCELALRGYLAEGAWETLPQSWKWLADFSVRGRPLNLLISVKSFTAKERLLMSGSGGSLSPTIGFGLFTDPSEWGPDRLTAYLLRGFTAIYVPARLLEKLPRASRRKRNLHGRPLLRAHVRLGRDLRRACQQSGGLIDVTML